MLTVFKMNSDISKTMSFMLRIKRRTAWNKGKEHVRKKKEHIRTWCFLTPKRISLRIFVHPIGCHATTSIRSSDAAKAAASSSCVIYSKKAREQRLDIGWEKKNIWENKTLKHCLFMKFNHDKYQPVKNVCATGVTTRCHKTMNTVGSSEKDVKLLVSGEWLLGTSGWWHRSVYEQTKCMELVCTCVVIVSSKKTNTGIATRALSIF